MTEIKDSSHVVLWVFIATSVMVVTLSAVFSMLRPQDTRVLGKNEKTKCTTIQDGILLRSDGLPVVIGFDEWGYNYQARLFNGMYCDAYRDAAWCQPYKDVNLSMKWNDAWLSNKDCDNDGLLDRHYDLPTYIGSGAWLTNHQDGTYEGVDGEQCNWNYFVKIVAAPSDAYEQDGFWYVADGSEIGPVIWGEFAIVEQVENDKCAGLSGMEYRSPSAPGFGRYKPKPTKAQTPPPQTINEDEI